MSNGKYKAVCYINQFFGQIGGEEAADIGFQVRREPVGPALLFQKLLEEKCQVIATII